jgi:hypothetical protein
MIRPTYPYGGSDCSRCDRFVAFDRNGYFRRHLAVEPDGRRRLCVMSGQRPQGVVQILTTAPSEQERYSHALRLLRTTS